MAAEQRTWPIGKTWDGGHALVTAQDVDAYAQATNDVHPAYYGPDAIAPPMFHTRLVRDVMFQIAQDPELDLDMVRLVHGGHDVSFPRPVHVGDLVQVRARLEHVADKRSGLLVVSKLFGFVDMAPAFEATTSYFIRAPRRPDDGTPKAAPPTRAAPPPTDFALPVAVDPDQSLRYAPASTDVNPIHLDPDFARKAGLPDIILHGLCTMALAGNALTARCGGNNPAWLRRLSVRFASPVFNGDALVVKGTEDEHGHRCHSEFWMENALGKAVLTQGVAEFAARHA